MKIINEKGKLFGVINIVDLLVVLAVIAVAAGIGYKLFAVMHEIPHIHFIHLRLQQNLANG